eukprot:GHVU01061968.1.p1 GENE.GHVU01061968.1~~GHVU01061968.1.p1  ORF type:complete len:270 (+),score=11.72 GHVU01061968.1:285-1094(+)
MSRLSRFFLLSNVRARKRYERRYRHRTWSDLRMYREVRVDHEGLRFLCYILRDELRLLRGKRGLPISPEVAILVTLQYLAYGDRQRTVAALHGLSQASASRCIRAVIRAVAAQKKQWIVFPTTPPHIDRVARAFQEQCGIVDVVGAIDCTHIPIRKPPDDDAQYFNRKGYRSLNVQSTCTVEGWVTSLSVKWPGSAHDSFVLEQSNLWKHFEVRKRRGILIGDAGYLSRVKPALRAKDQPGWMEIRVGGSLRPDEHGRPTGAAFAVAAR